MVVDEAKPMAGGERSGAGIRRSLDGLAPYQMVGHSTNLVGMSTGYLSDLAFNERPEAIHISGVREMNGPLFEMLDLAGDLAEAGEAFSNYMMAMFGIDLEQRDSRREGRRRYRSSYLRLIKGWGYDSNSPEGAVLKGWVESRFGIYPTYHRQLLDRFYSEGWTTYVQEKMSSRFHNNSIHAQLDLLYEFCQWALARFAAVGQSHLSLYRGINNFDEHPLTRRVDRRTVVMRMNALSSFTADRDIADCFGDIVLAADIPVQKVLFFNALLAAHPLKGEGEYLVIGGDYRMGISR